MTALDRAIDAATRRHALIQYRHASNLDQLTKHDWQAMRAFVRPLVVAALDAAREDGDDSADLPGQTTIDDHLEEVRT